MTFRNPLSGAELAALIPADSIPTTKLASNLESDNYNGTDVATGDATQGWRIERGTGSIEGNDVRVRGTLQGTGGNVTDAIPSGAINEARLADGAVGSLKIAANLQSDNYNGTDIATGDATQGWRIERDTGSIEGNDIRARGALQGQLVAGSPGGARVEVGVPSGTDDRIKLYNVDGTLRGAIQLVGDVMTLDGSFPIQVADAGTGAPAPLRVGDLQAVSLQGHPDGGGGGPTLQGDSLLLGTLLMDRGSTNPDHAQRRKDVPIGVHSRTQTLDASTTSSGNYVAVSGLDSIPVTIPSGLGTRLVAISFHGRWNNGDNDDRLMARILVDGSSEAVVMDWRAPRTNAVHLASTTIYRPLAEGSHTIAVQHRLRAGTGSCSTFFFSSDPAEVVVADAGPV